MPQTRAPERAPSYKSDRIITFVVTQQSLHTGLKVSRAPALLFIAGAGVEEGRNSYGTCITRRSAKPLA